jgi:hypothetical protein
MYVINYLRIVNFIIKRNTSVKTINAPSITQRLRVDGINFLKIWSERKAIKAAKKQMAIHNPPTCCSIGPVTFALLKMSRPAITIQMAVTIFSGVNLSFNPISVYYFFSFARPEPYLSFSWAQKCASFHGTHL